MHRREDRRGGQFGVAHVAYTCKDCGYNITAFSPSMIPEWWDQCLSCEQMEADRVAERLLEGAFG
jgi:transposase-like protein